VREQTKGRETEKDEREGGREGGKMDRRVGERKKSRQAS